MNDDKAVYSNIHEFSRILREKCEKAHCIKNEWEQTFQGIRIIVYEELQDPLGGKYFQIVDIFEKTWNPEFFTFNCIFEDFWQIDEFLENYLGTHHIEIMCIWNQNN